MNTPAFLLTPITVTPAPLASYPSPRCSKIAAVVQQTHAAAQWVDYLACHSLSEFPAYSSARTSRTDEPLFARGKWKRVVEHKTFGPGTALYRKMLDSGIAVVVVQYGDLERTLVMDAAYWITPIEALLRVKVQKVEEFKFPDGLSVERRPDAAWRGKDELPGCAIQLHRAKTKLEKGVPYDHLTMNALREKRYPTHCWVSAAGRACYERKLFAQVAEFAVKERERIEETHGFLRSARMFWKFCVAFEFPKAPKVNDQDAMEAAADHLLKSCPREHLEALVSLRTSNRHYVLGKRGEGDDLSFVRQQDSHLAMEL
jgi:hypothetical protein